MKVTKIGVVGCGDICFHTYMPNILDHFKNLEIYAVCDLDAERTRQFVEAFGIPRVMTMEEMCADPNIDIILNTTTPQAHYPLNMQALRAGKHVYCEKPLGLNLKQARETMALAAEKHLYVGCAPDVFMGPGAQTARKVIDEGQIGELIGAKAANMYHGPEFLHPRPDFLYKVGAGPMLDIGPYPLSAMLFLMGPVEELCCYGGIKLPQRYTPNPTEHMIDVEVNTFYTGIVKFRSGHSATVNFSWDTYCAENGPMVQIFGTKGTLHISDADNYGNSARVMLMREADLLGPDGKLDKDKVPHAGQYLRQLDLVYESPRENRGLGLSEMADAILHGRKNIANGEFACHLTELMDGFNVAIATGKPYHMETTFEIPPRLPVDYLEYARNYNQ